MPDRRKAVLCQKRTHSSFSRSSCVLFIFPAQMFSDDDISAFRICRVLHNDAFDNAVADDFSTCGGAGLDGGSRSGGKVVDGIARNEGIGGSVQIDADRAARCSVDRERIVYDFMRA